MTSPKITISDRISHEFRTPLTIIKEYASLMCDGLVGEVNSNQQRMLRVVEDRSDDLHWLVDNLMYLSRMSSGEQPITRRPRQLREVLDRLESQFRPKASLLGLRFDVVMEAGADELQVFGDDEQLLRVLLNLAQHATQHRCPEAEAVRMRIQVPSGAHSLRAQVRFCSEAPADGGRQLDSSAAHELGVSVQVAEQLTALNLGELQYRRGPEESDLAAEFALFEPTTIVRRYLQWLPAAGASPALAAIRVALAADDHSNDSTRRQLDSMLHYLTSANDLVLRVADRRWLMLAPSKPAEPPELPGRIEAMRRDLNARRPRMALPELAAETFRVWNLDEPFEAAQQAEIACQLQAELSGGESRQAVLS